MRRMMVDPVGKAGDFGGVPRWASVREDRCKWQVSSREPEVALRFTILMSSCIGVPGLLVGGVVFEDAGRHCSTHLRYSLQTWQPVREHGRHASGSSASQKARAEVAGTESVVAVSLQQCNQAVERKPRWQAGLRRAILWEALRR